MKRRRLLPLVVLASVLTLASFSACDGGGGGGGQSLEEYLEQYEEIDNRAEAATADLNANYADILSETQLTDENRPDVQTYFEDLGNIGQTYVDELSELNPPDEAQDMHDESIESYQRVLDLYQQARGGIGQATSIGELQALFDTPDINAALDDANADCATLQQLAKDNNIDVDFGCRG